MTTEQIKSHTKTVTRRFGWDKLQIGETINAVEKCMGLKRGERMKRLATIRIVGFRKEPLNAITDAECVLEGFPELTAAQFVEMLCKKSGHAPTDSVNRIEFVYV